MPPPPPNNHARRFLGASVHPQTFRVDSPARCPSVHFPPEHGQELLPRVVRAFGAKGVESPQGFAQPACDNVISAREQSQEASVEGNGGRERGVRWMPQTRGLKKSSYPLCISISTPPPSRSDRHLLAETLVWRGGRLSTVYELHSVRLRSSGGVPYVSAWRLDSYVMDAEPGHVVIHVLRKTTSSCGDTCFAKDEI